MLNLSKAHLFLASALLILFLDVIPLAAQRNAFTPTGIAKPLPSLEEALNSREDDWGLAAMRQTNGPSYEFFRDLLPPLRYVNAAFRHYPIILSAPGSKQKTRLVSNGSAVNPRANLATWKESGIPVIFSIGNGTNTFGSDPRKLQGPHYEQGYLPIVRLSQELDGARYDEETFSSTDPASAAYGVAFTQFKLSEGKQGLVSARIDCRTPLTVLKDTVRDTNGDIIVRFDDRWKWNPDRQTLTAALSRNQTATLMIATKPIPKNTIDKLRCDPDKYSRERKRCITTWEDLLATGAKVEVPEAVVNNAWRSLVIGNYLMAEGDIANYSWGNAYERLFEAESGDALRSLLLFGFTNDTRRMLPPLLDYAQDKLAFHNAGFKLQALTHYYWLTRDAAFVQSMKDRWAKEVKLISEGREKDSGLAPRENYCGDIHTLVYPLHSNAAAWRGLHDFAAVLADMGQTEEAKRIADVAADYRRKILAAVEKSERMDSRPPFIPIALFGEEKPHDPLTGTMLGSYWNLLAPYVLGSGILGSGSDREQAMLNYLQQKGGLFMGMIRFHQHSGLFANEDAVDDLYTLRYATTLLRLDRPDRALVSFYGKLAHGMTRDTFIGGEGTGLRALDEFGRAMYLPPNSSANANFLWTFRYLLLQDWDMDDDGKPETLRLLFATPRRWLEDGKRISIQHAPTAFGEVSIEVQSRLQKGEVIVQIDPPKRKDFKDMLLRVRLPDGWEAMDANIIKSKQDLRTSTLTVDPHGTIQIIPLKDKFTIRVRVQKK